MSARLIAFVFAITAIAGCASPPPVIRVELLKAGIFAIRGNVRSDPSMPQGQYTAVTRRRVLEETHEVPAALGTHFGVEFRVTSSPPRRALVPLTVQWITPPMTNPDTGETFSQSERSRPYETNRKHRIGYGFDRDWELVQGTWTLRFLHQGKIVAETEFHILPP